MTEPTDEYVAGFDARRYLRQYYSNPQLAHDDALLFQELTSWLKTENRVFDTALDFGCGPTIHNTFAIAPYSRRIELADYLPGNLAAVQAWLNGSLDAHDWDPLFRGVLQCEGTEVEQLEHRKALFRERVAALRPCDLRQAEPLGERVQYDLVTSFFCTECVAQSTAEWEVMIGRLFDLVRPGGAIFLAAVRDCERYRVLGQWFSATPVTEQDLAQRLMGHGFTIAFAKSVPAPDWALDGFDHICLVAATKIGPA